MICWFCHLTEEVPEKSCRMKLFGEVDARTDASATRVRYVVRRIAIPRCALCRSKHAEASALNALGALLAAAALACAAVAAFRAPSGFWAGILTGLAGGLSIGSFASGFLLHKGIASVRKARRSYPEIRELLDQGYRFGNAPGSGAIELMKDEKAKKDEKVKSEAEGSGPDDTAGKA